MEVLRKAQLPKKYELRMKREINIDIRQFFDDDYEVIPGFLSVKVDDYGIDYNEIEFFGVDRRGDDIFGKGVSPSYIGNSGKGEKVLLFNISNLIRSRQITDRTVEGVITLSGQEIGRDIIESNPNIYLG